MPKCPKCKKDIDHLKSFWKSEKCADYRVDSRGFERYENMEDVDCSQVQDSEEFECPECNAVISYDFSEARKFLNHNL